VSTLSIQLLGGFGLTHDGAPLTGIRAARHQSLLAYLLFNRRTHQVREHVAFVFWPESEESQALNNLRKALHHIRRQLPDADQFIYSDAKVVQWRPDATFALDVHEFEGHLESARRKREASDLAGMRTSLARAIELYHGDLLPSCYDDWIITLREQLRDRYLSALAELTVLSEEQGQLPEAIRYANQRLRADPLSEQVYRHLMQLHVRNGDPGSALRVYHACATTLKKEFGAQPGKLTQTVYEQLVSGDGLAAKVTALPTATQMVGREAEWKRMQQAWMHVLRGHTQSLLVEGDAGIGKTRLIEEFCTWAAQHDVPVAYTRAYAAEGALAFAPIADWLRTENFRPRWQRLDESWLTELARIVPELLVELPNLPRPQPITEGWERKRLFEAIARAIDACGRPLALALDDLQWCDRETLEWLHYLLRFDSAAPLLLIGGLRLGEVQLDHGSEHPLASLLFELRAHDQVTEIELGPLDRVETEALAASMAGHVGQSLPSSTLERLFHDSQGNPLFAGEMIRATLDGERADGGTYDSVIALPPRVQAMIQARLSQLSPAARSIANAAAIIGREFAVDVLAATCRDEVASDRLVQGLDELWQRRIVRDTSTLGMGALTYDFSHDRIRDVVVAGISPALRRQLHRRVAESLEALHADSLAEVSAQVAVHFDEAGDPNTASAYYLRAAEVLHDLFAYRDEKALLEKGLRCLSSLPSSRARDERRLSFLLALGPVHVVLSGVASLEMRRICEEALPLCTSPGHEEQLFRAQRGLWLHYLLRGQGAMAVEYAGKMLALSKSQGDEAWIAESERCLGIATASMGRNLDARRHFEEAIRLYPPERMLETLGVLEPMYGLDYVIWYSAALWVGGYPDQAVMRSDQGMALLRASQLPFSVVNGLEFVGRLRYFLGQPEAARRAALELLEVATKYEFGDYVNIGRIQLGWAKAHDADGDVIQALALFKEGLAGVIAAHVFADLTLYYAMLAEIQFMAGRIDDSLATLDNAIELADPNGEAFLLSELWRLRGEYHRRVDVSADVERFLAKALEIAQEQQAKSLELRAAVSLARLWSSAGRGEAAYQLLQPVYAWFTEGLDTRDLTEARELLRILSLSTPQPP
jgi:DNA-binding SARP family transcriptional activator